MMKKALLITYYWPPAGGAGVHRWLRFSNFFKENNVNLHVYCPDSAAYPMIDKDLEREVSADISVIKRKIFEPHKVVGKKNNPNVSGGFTQSKKTSLVQKLIIWIRGNLFIPDARMFWIRPSSRFLKSYLSQNPDITTMISTGPPHSVHMIALRLKKKFPEIQWIADFRDPWTDIDFYNDLNIGKWANKRHHQLEKLCLDTADKIVTVSDNCALDLERTVNKKVEVITNGYNFPERGNKVNLDEKFTICHFGSLPFSRNPEVLWECLSILCKENEEFANDLEVKLYGPSDFLVVERINFFKLNDKVRRFSIVKHSESIKLQEKAQLLLLVANNTGNVKGILTGKFFEYLGAYRPILAIGSKDSDLENAVNSTKSGAFIGNNELDKLKAELLEFYALYKENKLKSNSRNIDIYSSKHLAKKYCELIN